MDCPLYLKGRCVGAVCITRAGEDTLFSVEGSAPPGLYRLTVRGEGGELVLGVWEGGALRRRFSRAMTDGLGAFLSAEAAALEGGDWLPAPPERFPGRRVKGGLCRRRGRLWQLALPLDPDGPFPLPDLFCLAQVRWIGGRERAVFSFNESGEPVLPPKF